MYLGLLAAAIEETRNQSYNMGTNYRTKKKKKHNGIDKNEIFVHTVEVDYATTPHDENYGSRIALACCV